MASTKEEGETQKKAHDVLVIKVCDGISRVTGGIPTDGEDSSDFCYVLRTKVVYLSRGGFGYFSNILDLTDVMDLDDQPIWGYGILENPGLFRCSRKDLEHRRPSDLYLIYEKVSKTA